MRPRPRLYDVMPFRVALLWGLLPAAGVGLTSVLLYGGQVGILGKLYAFFGFWAWFAIPFGVLFLLVSGAVSVVSEWRYNRWVRKDP